jgi:chemotaxis methyl-accepting protein methylase
MIRGEALDAAVDRVSELLEQRIGLRTEPTARSRLRRGIRDELAGQGLDLEHYQDAVAARGPALQSLLNRITVQETSFFRHPEHFEVLARDILPRLAPPVRIWSVGCANGQEAYTLAMVLEEQGIAGSVIATDLSTDAVRRTADGRYTARETSGLSPTRMARHLTRSGAGWEVNAPLRARVTVLRHNLLEPIPDRARACQVIFCRNVLIYISREYAKGFLDGAADTVKPVALFLGSAETIWSITTRFETVSVGATFFYRPRPAGGAVRTRIPAPAPARPAPARPAPAPSRTAPVSGRATRSVPTRPARPRPVEPPDGTGDSAAAALLASEGGQALAAGDHRSAVISFRKWAYLTPGDALAYLHLGLALEAAGDQASAQRAFEAARSALTAAGPGHVEHAMEGYATDELLRLLDGKQQAVRP